MSVYHRTRKSIGIHYPRHRGPNVRRVKIQSASNCYSKRFTPPHLDFQKQYITKHLTNKTTDNLQLQCFRVHFYTITLQFDPHTPGNVAQQEEIVIMFCRKEFLWLHNRMDSIVIMNNTAMSRSNGSQNQSSFGSSLALSVKFCMGDIIPQDFSLVKNNQSWI